MSSPLMFLPTPPDSLGHGPRTLPSSSVSSAHVDRERLAAEIDRQRDKIRAFELAAQERRKGEQLRVQERLSRTASEREEERRQLVRLKELQKEERQAFFYQQEEQRRRDRQARDESAMRAHLRHKAAEEARKANDEAVRQGRLAETEQRRLTKLTEKEQRRVLELQQDEQRRKDRQVRDESAMRAHLRHKAAVEAQKAEEKLVREEAEGQRLRRAIAVDERQALRSLQEDHRRNDREQRDDAGMQAHLRHKAIAQARRIQQKSLAEQRIVAYDGPIPSFLDQEYQYMRQASTTFPEAITSSIQMSCMKAYQKAISDASRRLPCGLCGGLVPRRRGS
jgi:hypothetical protein